MSKTLAIVLMIIFLAAAGYTQKDSLFETQSSEAVCVSDYDDFFKGSFQRKLKSTGAILQDKTKKEADAVNALTGLLAEHDSVVLTHCPDALVKEIDDLKSSISGIANLVSRVANKESVPSYIHSLKAIQKNMRTSINNINTFLRDYEQP